MKAESQKELFFPYYVNQGRLLDIYAILNNGYSEYAEITTAINEEHTKGGRADANGTVGFKLFNFVFSLFCTHHKVESNDRCLCFGLKTLPFRPRQG